MAESQTYSIFICNMIHKDKNIPINHSPIKRADNNGPRLAEVLLHNGPGPPCIPRDEVDLEPDGVGVVEVTVDPVNGQSIS